jgi:hypothetical protein
MDVRLIRESLGRPGQWQKRNIAGWARRILGVDCTGDLDIRESVFRGMDRVLRCDGQAAVRGFVHECLTRLKTDGVLWGGELMAAAACCHPRSHSPRSSRPFPVLVLIGVSFQARSSPNEVSKETLGQDRLR